MSKKIRRLERRALQPFVYGSVVVRAGQLVSAPGAEVMAAGGEKAEKMVAEGATELDQPQNDAADTQKQAQSGQHNKGAALVCGQAEEDGAGQKDAA
ncbi:hypothetical protein BACCAP_04367 [Pseudoflavonifractor capillosus ATCC 29799]|uniref:Uncharacterized protein n=1 Tax=Pseudoflavonifractor capillosus ATCC 29799 TaxID=411467 RepID=A6P1K0_9FIRM|nr:hypothetical protein BACCAP_04367 [Pseudoflavonifractor capillosus ATCC 29799]